MVRFRSGVTMTAEVLRRAVVAGATLAASASVEAPKLASARGADGKETGAFAAESYSQVSEGLPEESVPRY